jgi:hypothetical protein
MMPGMRSLIPHLSVAILAVTTAAATPAAAQSDGTATFAVLVRGARIGSTSTTMTRTPTGWRIEATGRLQPPVDLITTKFEMNYASDWHPVSLSIEGTFRGQLFTLSTSFGVTTATSQVLQGGVPSSGTQQVAARSVVLPNNFFGAYEALAARLASLEVGATLPIYIAPEFAATATVSSVTPRRIVTPDGTFDLMDYGVTVAVPGGSLPIAIWVDEDRRLARVAMPASNIVAVREDISSVLAREETVRNAGDEAVFIPASGFSLGATITRPSNGAAQARAVILIASSDARDRDQAQYGVPVLGQLAGDLADAGFFVVRYDRRGIGQSGGRTENATLDDYATDVRGIVSWLRRREDVDDDRIAAVGYGDGGAVALLAARRESRIKAVGLLASPGQPGRDVTLAQQERELARLPIAEVERQARVDLQRRIIEAVLSGQGWEAIPPGFRRQADTPWFRSWLQFDPADVIRRIDEPILILQGSRDAEVPGSSADRLEELSLARGKAVTHTRKVSIPDLNHLLVPAGAADDPEYATLSDRTVSPAVAEAIAEWLNQVMPPEGR